jgi:hypothetical protein
MYITYVYRPGQIPEEHNDFCSSARLSNTRWVHMFLGHVRSPRNTTYVPRLGQEAKEHKVGLMFLSPAEEHKRPICESRPFFCSSPLFCAPLPAPHAPATPRLPAPHAPATPALPWPRPAGHTPPYPDPALPCLGHASNVWPCPTVCVGCSSPPRSAHRPLALPGRVH